ncbi:alpha/beta hydrolase [Chamaesiphon minutus]|uniref:Phospholipase/Carboxylesterase/Putative lysophospholipase n=1 Tax=Chamaesiphon minutus (strain ATCC 27169 / PCC 6605) TaxID=1173020 RepID=K9UHC6_CHAP6|nr:alpha/beta hydrolase [Chamaesiphon minutus]AFY94512.1 Phospholipase/Carboxylesterase/Putative lysophospholipase [Chamaesiphon minutus PCC 6605]
MRQFPFHKLLVGDFSWQKLGQLLLFVYVCFTLIIFVRADSMIFLPQPASYIDTKDIIKLPIAKTEQISAIYLPNPQAKYTLLYIHGNAEDLGDIRSQLERLHSWGFSVFAYDYRGYGTSSGKPSESNAYEDADAAYTYLTGQIEIPASQIIIYGRSVGGGSATELAANNTVGGLILESTFTSAFRVVVPFPLLPFDKFTNLDKISKVRCPVLVMHGQSDEIIPFDHGRSLYKAAPQPKMYLWIANAGHNDFTDVAGARHQQALLSFQQLIETHR